MNYVMYKLAMLNQTVLAFSLTPKAKEVLNTILGWAMAVALTLGVINLIVAALKREDDPGAPKKALVTLAWVVLGTGIVFSIASAAGLGDVATDPFGQGQ